MMNSDLDMSEYPVDRMSWTKDIFFGVFSLLRLHMINETIRNEDPGREARAKGKKTKKNLPCRMSVFDGLAEENELVKDA